MGVERTSCTDERIDDLVKRIDERFDEVDRRFGAVERRLDRIEDELIAIRREMRTQLIVIMFSILGGYLTLAGAILART
jgi:hypothetical protein